MHAHVLSRLAFDSLLCFENEIPMVVVSNKFPRKFFFTRRHSKQIPQRMQYDVLIVHRDGSVFMN